MKFKCPNCELNLTCDDELAGQAAKCPSCGAKVTVPTPKRAAGKAADAGDTGATGAADGGAQSAAWQPTDTSNVSGLLSFGLAVVFMIAFFLITFPLRGTYFGALFWERGWVPFVLVLLLGWSFSILALKMRKLRRQKRAMLLDVLPESIGTDITVYNVEKFLRHIAELPQNLQESLIVKRIQLGLQHFQVRQSNPEVANMLMTQSEMDANTISSSYSALKVFLWAIPILGFIGTVIGISNAVSGFSGSLEAAQNIEVLKDSLNSVTMGLAVAFDTTLVALVMSLIVSFPSSAMQKNEEDLLGYVDAYCNENLLKRLDDTGGIPKGAETAENEDTVRAVAIALNQGQKEILEEFRKVQEEMGTVQAEQKEVVGAMAEAVEEQLESMEARAAAHQEKLNAAVTGMVDPIREAMEGLIQNGQTLQTDAAKMITDSTKTVTTHMTALAEGLDGLNKVLTDLGSKQVVVQQSAPRRRWLAFLSRK